MCHTRIFAARSAFFVDSLEFLIASQLARFNDKDSLVLTRLDVGEFRND